MISDILRKLKTNNRLNNYVIDYYINDSENYETVDELLSSMEELQRYGCSSGMIKDLIYYDDTIKFFNKYKEEINQLLSNVIEETGCSIEELFGDRYDKTDPLFINYVNQNLLSWFGFEKTVSNLYDNIYEKVKESDFSISLS